MSKRHVRPHLLDHGADAGDAAAPPDRLVHSNSDNNTNDNNTNNDNNNDNNTTNNDNNDNNNDDHNDNTNKVISEGDIISL